MDCRRCLKRRTGVDSYPAYLKMKNLININENE
jgi:hypothetical protein